MLEVIQNIQDPIFTSGQESVCRSWIVSARGDQFLANLRQQAGNPETELQRTRDKAVFLLEMPEGKFVLKRYHEHQFFRYLFRSSQALRELNGYRLAAELQLPAARVVACGDIRHMLYLKEDFIVTEYIDGSHSGNELSSQGTLRHETALRDAYIRENIRRLARLHDAGYTHGGAHPRNFLWDGTADHLQIMWIDLATVRRHPEGVSRPEGAEALHRHFLSKFDLNAKELAEMKELYCDSRQNRL